MYTAELHTILERKLAKAFEKIEEKTPQEITRINIAETLTAALWELSIRGFDEIPLEKGLSLHGAIKVLCCEEECDSSVEELLGAICVILPPMEEVMEVIVKNIKLFEPSDEFNKGRYEVAQEISLLLIDEED